VSQVRTSSATCSQPHIVIPPPNADALAAAWPGTEVELFTGGGHAFFALEPQRVADRITAFCTG
jgi:pimeloyl-ACP methyl ester carboxylesterase